MNILFLSHYFPPEGNAPATRVHSMCRRWVEAGHKVTVITSAPNVPDGVVYDGYSNKLRQVEEIDGIRVVRVWTSIAPNKGTVRRIANYISYMISAFFFGLFEKKPDLIIATSPQPFCGGAGTFLSFFKHKPFILEIRDIWPESIIAVGAIQNKKLVRLLQWLELKLYASACHIVTVGDGYKQRLLEKNVKEEKISIVTNGLDDAMFIPQNKDKELIKKFNVEEKFVCSYVGTIGMACGLGIVLEASRKLREQKVKDVHFLLVGDGAVRLELQKMVDDEGLEDYITFTGRQPKELMPNFFSISDVCLVHLKETDLFTTVLPSKIFEAAGMERPIINGVKGQAMKIVKDANAGIGIEPENAEQLIDAIMKLKKNRKLARKYGKSGRKYVQKYFNRDNLANDYLAILKKVIAR
ncbi:MAG: glycosyltransferase family 4 protein [Verrucomicrobiota bacterium]|nr:glycosyltransferase family 4 protein [Verrucomicrobiota bacterium]